MDDLKVPEGVRLVIARRLDRVSDETQRVLRFAAVVGRSFSLELLEAIGDVTGDRLLDALEAAEQAYLIVSTSSQEARWEFSHALIRQTLSESLSVPRRQRLHLRVADAIEQAASPEPQVSDIAHHLHQAGRAADPEKTVRYLTLAGDQALEAGAFDEALRHFSGALTRLSEDEQRQVADLRYKKGRALRSLGRWAESDAELKGALPIYEVLGDGPAITTVCWELAYLMVWTARGREAASVAARGLEALGPEASADRCRLLAIGGWGLGNGAERSDEVVAGDEMLSQSLAMADALEDPRAHRDAIFSSVYKHFLCMRCSEQADSALRAAELMRSAGDLWKMTDALVLFQMASVFCGRLDGVARFEEETDALFRRLGHLGGEYFGRWSQGQRDWLVSGDLAQFESSAKRITEVATSAGSAWGSINEAWLAQTSLWRGDWEKARNHAQEVTRREPSSLVVGHHWSYLFLCECFLGHKETALDSLEDRRGGLPSTGRANTVGAWMMLIRVIEGLSVLGERDAAAELYPLTLEAIQTGTVTGWDAHHLLETVAGIAAAAGGQWEQAETHYQTALKQAHEIPFRSEQPEARRWYAEMLVERNASGDRDRARTMLTEAVEMYQQIGMPRHVEMSKDALKGL